MPVQNWKPRQSNELGQGILDAAYDVGHYLPGFRQLEEGKSVMEVLESAGETVASFAANPLVGAGESIGQSVEWLIKDLF